MQGEAAINLGVLDEERVPMAAENNSQQACASPLQWTEAIPAEQWSIYQEVIRRARSRGIPFALGGAFSVATYSGRWRETKDLDLYILPRDREAMVQVLSEAGLQDYFDQLPYERHWIYRSFQGDNIVDIIWGMANRRAEVDEFWLEGGPVINVRGETVRVVPIEEIIWSKLYVLQKERCDWPDLFNIIHETADCLDWGRLLARLDQDVPLLEAMLTVFCWLSPRRAQDLPQWLITRLDLPDSQVDFSTTRIVERASHLDTRPWFGPAIQE